MWSIAAFFFFIKFSKAPKVLCETPNCIAGEKAPHQLVWLANSFAHPVNDESVLARLITAQT